MIINNAEFNSDLLGTNDLLIICLGYEPRSCALLTKAIERVNLDNILCLYFIEYSKNPETVILYEKIQDRATVVECQYSDYRTVENAIRNMLRNKTFERIHVDYSSMPRSWYCRIPKIVEDEMTEKQESYFWYCEGIYPDTYEEYPNAGYEDISLFAGKNSFATSASRTHVLGIGFDNFRTEAIMNELDPSHFIVCMAYDFDYKEFSDNLRYINRRIIPQAEMAVSFNIGDFVGMYSSLKELGCGLLYNGDVIFVPDGPKPLIMAMSLAVQNINTIGLTCLHIHRNNNQFMPVEVRYNDGHIWGFIVKKDSVTQEELEHFNN